jgi:hypothetical protein
MALTNRIARLGQLQGPTQTSGHQSWVLILKASVEKEKGVLVCDRQSRDKSVFFQFINQNAGHDRNLNSSIDQLEQQNTRTSFYCSLLFQLFFCASDPLGCGSNLGCYDWLDRRAVMASSHLLLERRSRILEAQYAICAHSVAEGRLRALSVLNTEWCLIGVRCSAEE